MRTRTQTKLTQINERVCRYDRFWMLLAAIPVLIQDQIMNKSLRTTKLWPFTRHEARQLIHLSILLLIFLILHLLGFTPIILNVLMYLSFG